jgi:malonyl-CoA O-methyltransferase
MSDTAPFVDAHKVRRNFARAAATYDEAAVLQREVASRMLERLDYVKIAPQRVLDVGCGTGGSLTALGERYPKSFVFGADASEAMLLAGRGQRRACAGYCLSCAATRLRCSPPMRRRCR